MLDIVYLAWFSLSTFFYAIKLHLILISFVSPSKPLRNYGTNNLPLDLNCTINSNLNEKRRTRRLFYLVKITALSGRLRQILDRFHGESYSTFFICFQDLYLY